MRSQIQPPTTPMCSHSYTYTKKSIVITEHKQSTFIATKNQRKRKKTKVYKMNETEISSNLFLINAFPFSKTADLAS